MNLEAQHILASNKLAYEVGLARGYLTKHNQATGPIRRVFARMLAAEEKPRALKETEEDD